MGTAVTVFHIIGKHAVGTSPYIGGTHTAGTGEVLAKTLLELIKLAYKLCTIHGRIDI